MSVATVIAWSANLLFGNPVTASVDVGTGTGRVAYVMLGSTHTTPAPTSVTIGSDSLAAQGAQQTDGNGYKYRLYAGALNVTGVQTVTATWDNNLDRQAMVGVVFSGVDTDAVIGGLAWQYVVADTAYTGTAVTSAAGSMVCALMQTGASETFTPSAPATLLTGAGLGAGTAYHGVVEAGAASVVIDGTFADIAEVRAFLFNVPAASSAASVAFDAIIPALQWSGAASSPMLAALAGALPPLAWSGSALLSAGRLTSRAFHNGAVMPLASGAIPYVLVCSLDLASATRFSAQSYNASGLWSVADAAIVPGTSYLVLYSDGAGTYASETLTAT